MSQERPRTRIALVTGANKGIGYEIARALLADGAIVILGCRDPLKGSAAARQLSGSGAAVSIELDVTRYSTLETAA